MGEMFGEELRRLRQAAGLSMERLSRLTVTTGDEGLSSKTIEALERKLERVPDDRTVILLGRALASRGQQLNGLELAEARRLLDERQVGYEEAAANLERVRKVLRPLGVGAPPELPAELGRFDGAGRPNARKARRTPSQRAEGSR